MITPVDYGRRSKIFDEGNNTILKLYDPFFSKQKIEDEFNNTKTIFQIGRVPVPKPIELIKRGESMGILFQKVEGISLMNMFQNNPILYFTYGKMIAELHRTIHRVSHIALPSQIELFTPVIQNTTRLSPAQKAQLLLLLNESNERKLCHGDFHHGNIMKTKKGTYFILDWMDAFAGDPMLDVALTAVNAAVSDAPPHIPAIYAKMYDVLKKLLRLDLRYLKLYGVNESSMRKNLILAAGIHLCRAEQDLPKTHRAYFALRLKK